MCKTRLRVPFRVFGVGEHHVACVVMDTRCDFSVDPPVFSRGAKHIGYVFGSMPLWHCFGLQNSTLYFPVVYVMTSDCYI